MYADLFASISDWHSRVIVCPKSHQSIPGRFQLEAFRPQRQERASIPDQDNMAQVCTSHIAASHLRAFVNTRITSSVLHSAKRSFTTSKPSASQYAANSQDMRQDRTNYSGHIRFLKGLISSMVMKHRGSAPSAKSFTCGISLRLTTQTVTFTGPFRPYPDVSVAP